MLPEHEKIASEHAPAGEFSVLDDEPDEEAIRARAMQRQFRGIARQAALDPDDGIPL